MCWRLRRKKAVCGAIKKIIAGSWEAQRQTESSVQKNDGAQRLSKQRLVRYLAMRTGYVSPSEQRMTLGCGPGAIRTTCAAVSVEVVEWGIKDLVEVVRRFILHRSGTTFGLSRNWIGDAKRNQNGDSAVIGWRAKRGRACMHWIRCVLIKSGKVFVSSKPITAWCGKVFTEFLTWVWWNKFLV